jgi:3-deoxy-D-manno-octulosonate 8-phosphate phosphatase (KDO 8-P phosphatase)
MNIVKFSMGMNILSLFKPVTTFVFDVDGVLTNGMLLVLPEGLMARQMNIKDGYALQLAVKQGYRVVVISGGYSPEVENRLNKLGIYNVFMRVEDKLGCLQQYMAAHGLQPQEILYMGDDVPDYAVMQAAGLPCCPADAAVDIRNIAKYISPFKGGEGCGRDVIEKVLKLNGHWAIDLSIRSK